MELRFTEKIVAVLADAVQPCEEALIVDALALDVDEAALAERMTHEGAGVGDADARAHEQ